MDWSPPRAVASSLEALATELAMRSEVLVLVPAHLRHHVDGLETIAPRTRFEVETAGVGDVLVGEFEVVRTGEGWSTGSSFGVGHDGSVLVLDRAPLSPSRWAATPTVVQGGCEALEADLGALQELGLVALEPFLEGIDDRLYAAYRRALVKAIPQLRRDLQRLSPRCRAHYALQIDGLAECGESQSACPSRPRVYLVGGIRLGVPVPEATKACTDDRGLEEALGAPADLAVASTLADLDPAGSELADRLGHLTEAYGALQEICTARRWRFDPQDLDVLRREAAGIRRTMAASNAGAESPGWRSIQSAFRVPGTGTVRELARFEAGPGNLGDAVVRVAEGVRDLALERGRCPTPSGELPLVAVLIEDGRVVFVDFVYDEQPSCGDMGPALEASGRPSPPSAL